ncbi:MAG: flagellar motor switch protein FliN [Acidobacteriaceae bacterium]
MDKERSLHLADLFANAFADALKASLRRQAPESWELRLNHGRDPLPPLRSARQFRLVITGQLQGACLVDLSEDEAGVLDKELGDLAKGTIAGEARGAESSMAAATEKVEGESAGHHAQAVQTESAAKGEAVRQSALECLLDQAMQGLGDALTALYGATRCSLENAPVKASPQPETGAGTTEEGPTVLLELLHGDAMKAGLRLSFDEQLLQGMRAAQGSDSGVAGSARVKKKVLDAGNLSLVLDVELNVSLRFGQSQLPLREVLDLASGSVIELDRDVDDPVELLLDGKVIARGEAVIVDGNYGMRITEIPEPIAGNFF